MKNDNKKYNLNEGRVIRTNNINYGGFPKNLNEVAEPTIITAQTPTNSNGAGGPAPGIPAGPPPGEWDRSKPFPPPGNSPEWLAWWLRWQEDNRSKAMWELMQQWFMAYGNSQRVN